MQENVNKFSGIKERIIHFIESQGIKKKDFFDKIGITSANFRGKAQNTPLNSTTIENIFTHYPSINLHWLITGKGDMIINGNYKKIAIDEPVSNNEIIVAQKKTINVLENQVEDLRQDKEFLKNVIDNGLGKANAS